MLYSPLLYLLDGLKLFGSCPWASKALVGFDGVVVKVLDSGGAALSERRMSFYNDRPCADTPCTALDDSYWLIGRVRVDEQYDPDKGALVRDTYTWQQNQGDDQLLSELREHRPTDTWLASRIQYTYEPINPIGHQFGALSTKLEQEKKNNGSWENYRCTVYGYAHQVDLWLVNRPIQETIKAPGCGGTDQARTLYRYNDNTSPDDQTVEDNLPTYIMRWDGANYVTEKRTYAQAGLLETVTTYTEPTAGLTSYPATARNTTTYVYEAESLGVPTRIESSGELFTTEKQELTYNTRFPWLVAEVKYNDLTTKYTYDDFGRLTKVHNPGDATDKPTVAYYYHDSGSKILLQPHAVGIIYKQDAGAARSDERLFYDGLGRLVQTQTANVAIDGISGERDVVVSYRYDARGLETCRTAPHEKEPYDPNTGQNPYWSEGCSTLAHTATQYDALGRPVAVTTPDNATSQMSYTVNIDITVDTRNRFHIMTTFDGNNHAVSQLTDVYGRLALVREYTGSGGGAVPYADTRYSYDVLGNLTAVRTSAAGTSEPAGNDVLRKTTIEYDKLGRKTKLVDKDMGEWTYAYDVAGNLRRQKSPDNKAICFYFDGLNRPAQRQIDNTPGNPACPAMLDRTNLPASAPNHLASYVYGGDPAAHDVGQLRNVYWSAAPRANNDVFTYDAEGRLKTQTRTVNGQGFVKEVTTYDAHDRPTHIKYPDLQTLVYGYDEEGINSITYDNTPIVSQLTYTALGQPAKVDRAGALADTTYDYHEAGENFRLKSIAHGTGATFPGFTYGGYDNAGNLTNHTIWGNAYTYGYDALNRLSSVGGNISHTYIYDELGNIESVTKAGALWDYVYELDTTLAHKPLRLTNVSGLGFSAPLDSASYDARGNLTKYKQGNVTFTLGYDVEGRLTSVMTKVGTQAAKTTTFTYDADGNRVRVVYPDNGGDIYTPFPDVEKAIAGGVTTWRITFSVNGQAAAQWVKADGTVTLYSLHTDHLGSVVAVGNAGGGRVDGSYAAYEPFGTFLVPPTQTNPSVTDRGFTGHRHNNLAPAYLGLIYMNARYYHPQLGRFTSPDTIVPDPTNPQSYNRYAYGFNNPVKYVDQDGHCPQPSGEWANVNYVCIGGFIPVVQSPSAKEYPELSPDLQSQVDLYNDYAATADVIALGMSIAGAVTEIGIAAVDTISPIGDLAGVVLYYKYINPVEDTASFISFISTFTADVAEGANYFHLDPLEVGVGQDTLVSSVGILLGNVLPVEGILDTLINIPLAWYSVRGAAGDIITYVEFRWTEELRWHFIAYPPPSGSQESNDD